MLSGTVCKFYQKGNCKFGSRCKFLHVDNNNGASNRNAFNSGPSGGGLDAEEYYQIRLDPALTVFSKGGKDGANLISGRDMSPEELRLQYLEAASSNKLEEYNRMIDLRKRDMAYCFDYLKSHANEALMYLQGNTNPFIPLTVEASMQQLANQNTGFSNSANGFGSSGFGSSAFGASNASPFGNSGTSAFGAP